ncbi:hypothetical protein [Rhodoferax sp.]|uniref:hypothetical protein n=1 Tax=Rhodoferax sp. TaxID=50421 RepID=UPI002ACE23E7|nr:hypothetical protein [Rhodoferax sp.]MDZ7918921.1 hypothetical protein [Rhodoferax sp.]
MTAQLSLKLGLFTTLRNGISMRKTAHITAIILGGLTLSILFASLGFAFGVDNSGKNLNEVIIPLLSMISGWVSGIGALIAAVVALNIAERQATHEHQQDAVRCLHHSMAITNDLKSRVHSLRLTLTQGNRPLVVLNKYAETIERRYEMLYDREIYRHLPGDVIGMITGMAGSFFGLTTLVEGLASGLKTQPHELMAPPQADTAQGLNASFEKLENELDALFTKLSAVRQRLEK